MCNCVELINEKLKEAGAKTKIKEVFSLSNDLGVSGSRVSIETLRVDGSRSRKNDPIVTASYCPFCGEKYEKGTKAMKYVVYSSEDGIMEEFNDRDEAITSAKELLEESLSDYGGAIPDEKIENGHMSVFKVEAESQVVSEEMIEQYEKRTGEKWPYDFDSLVDVQMVDLKEDSE